MSNVAKSQKAEITRIRKREAKSAVQGIAKSDMWVREIVADLRKRVFRLERENKRLIAALKKYQAEYPQKSSEEPKKVRLTSKGIRSLRKRLRLSQADFAKLLGKTAHSVYLWEKKDGALNLRDKTKAALVSIRELSEREAREKSAMIQSKSKKAKAVANLISALQRVDSRDWLV